MGHHFFPPPRPANPKGFFEASMLGHLCRRWYKEPWMIEQTGYQRRVQGLRAWADSRRMVDRMVGGKHPTLCLMVPELFEAWANCRFIAIDRPMEDSIKSLLSRPWKWPPECAEMILPMMIEKRDGDLKGVDPSLVLRISYSSLLDETEATVRQVCDFLDYEPTEEQLRQAISFVDPELQTVK
jgi:hypothetical protein